jgi:alpha-L-rhamnosidase
MYGEIVSGWKLEEEQLIMEVEIPANTTASIYVPGDPVAIDINGSALVDLGWDHTQMDGATVFSTGSGTYTIKTSLQEP